MRFRGRALLLLLFLQSQLWSLVLSDGIGRERRAPAGLSDADDDGDDAGVLRVERVQDEGRHHRHGVDVSTAAARTEARGPTSSHEWVTTTSLSTFKDDAKVKAGGRLSRGFDRSEAAAVGGSTATREWEFRGRRPRQSEAATFFNSLDENADGVLAENEIREFVGYVGGSTLDDNSEILGGVSGVMGRLDTDSDRGIGLKELSSWINRLGSMLTVEEAADWVTHAVQLPSEVAEAFRSNSISAYDFPELIEDNGAGLYDLGIKRKFRKRIIKAIEVRLLGLGEEPPRPVLNAPVYLGSGKARIEWSAGDAGAGSEAPVQAGRSSHDDLDHAVELLVSAAPTDPVEKSGEEDGRVGQGSTATAAAAASALEGGLSGGSSGEYGHRTRESSPWPSSSPSTRSATFPVHKYVLQRSCLHTHAAASVSASEGTTGVAAAAAAAAGAAAAVEKWVGVAGGSNGDRSGQTAATCGGGGWVTVHEEDDVEFLAASRTFVFVDSGLSAGKTYVYRVQAWNLIGHGEAPTAHVTIPRVSSLWTKPWRLISPWRRTGNGSAASLPHDLAEGNIDGAAMIDDGDDGGRPFMETGRDPVAEGQGDWGWWDVFVAACSVVSWIVRGISWVGWAVMQLLKLLQAVLVLATLQANLTRLGAAYGRGGTGAAVRRNWAASLVWKLNRMARRSRLVSRIFLEINNRLDRIIGQPPSPLRPPTGGGGRGLRRQSSTRDLLGRGEGSDDRLGGAVQTSSRRVSRERSSRARRGNDFAGNLSRIDEGLSAMRAVDSYGKDGRRRSSRYVSRSELYAGHGPSSAPPAGKQRLSTSPSASSSELNEQHGHHHHRQQQQQQQQGRQWDAGRSDGTEGQRMSGDRREGEAPSPEFHRRYRHGGYVGDAGAAGADGFPGRGKDEDRGQRAVDATSASGLGSGSGSRYSLFPSSIASLPQQQHPQPPPSSGGRSGIGDSGGSSGGSSGSGGGGPSGSSSRAERSMNGSGTGGGTGSPGQRGGWFRFSWGRADTSLGESEARSIREETATEAGATSGYLSEEDEAVDDAVSYFSDVDGGLSDDEFPAHAGDDGAGDFETDDFGGVEMRPALHRTGSSLRDLRKSMHFRKGSVSRLALGLKKGEAHGRESWRQEVYAAEYCYSCRKPFKTMTRQRHHCGRCHRVFCSKHGYTSHLRGTVCRVPGDCICDFCLDSQGGDGEGSDSVRDERGPTNDRVEVGACSKQGSQSDGGEKGDRRFRWGVSTSFSHLRRIRRNRSDQSSKEVPNEEAFCETASRHGEGGGANGRSKRNSRRSAGPSAVGMSSALVPDDAPVPTKAGRSLTASPSADGGSPPTVMDYRVAAAGGNRDSGDADADADAAVAVAAGRQRDASVVRGNQRVRREGGEGSGVLGPQRRVAR